MNSLPQKERATVLKLSKEELRQRILAVVNARGQATTMEIWRSSAPNFLPWDSMIEEIHHLHRQKKLRREAVAPGHIVIHALPDAKPASATKAAAARPITQEQKPLPTAPVVAPLIPAKAEPTSAPPATQQPSPAGKPATREAAATATPQPSSSTAKKQRSKRTAKAQNTAPAAQAGQAE